jgi:hypothetical protein
MLSILRVRLESHYNKEAINLNEVEASDTLKRCFDFVYSRSIQTCYTSGFYMKSLSMTPEFLLEPHPCILLPRNKKK